MKVWVFGLQIQALQIIYPIQKKLLVLLKAHNYTVRVGDGKELKAIGIGTIELAAVTDGELVKIEVCDVLFVPEMSVNLISIGKLLKRGFDVNFINSKCQIIFNEELVAECNPRFENNNLYEFKIKKKR